MDYCTYCSTLPPENIHVKYHGQHYGFPLHSDDELFGRLLMEIFQAGLSWEIILKKEVNFRLAFDNFLVQKVAKYEEEDILRLLGNPGIIRNRLKISSVIHNARVVQNLQSEFGSFEVWLDSHLGKNREEWTKVFKKEFRFVGGEILNEFLMSTGYIRGAHIEKCSIFKKVLDLKPKWFLHEQGLI